ncbi:hypothetical protein [Cytobacillus praedii]|uniref:hypothetical protein n=1 Tax=Cytobacillus praedii TaxID=1742358 RepID=UPI002E25157B|nr:hypothetical protein [Cytobacillus praedii]
MAITQEAYTSSERMGGKWWVVHVSIFLIKCNVIVQEVAAMLLNLKIVDGFDIVDYSGYRNPDILKGRI